MTSEHPAATSRRTCQYPGCDQPAAPGLRPRSAAGVLRGPRRHQGRCRRERRRLTAAATGAAIAADTSKPVTMARLTGAELLRSLRAEADRAGAGIASQIRETVETLTDPTAAEAEVEAARSAAEQRATAAEATRAAAEQRAAEADQFRAEADAAAGEMAVQLAAAERRADEAEADRDAEVERARQDATARIAAAEARAVTAEAERDAAIGQARAEAEERVGAAEAVRDQARADAAQAGERAGQAQQETARAQADADAAREETRRVHANAEKMLTDYRAETTAELAAVRADLRARAERAEAEADAYRAELAQLRAGASAVNEPPSTGGPASTRHGHRTGQAAEP